MSSLDLLVLLSKLILIFKYIFSSFRYFSNLYVYEDSMPYEN
jgi:hypothetical protein